MERPHHVSKSARGRHVSAGVLSWQHRQFEQRSMHEDSQVLRMHRQWHQLSCAKPR